MKWTVTWILSVIAAFLVGQQLGKLSNSSTAIEPSTHIDAISNNSIDAAALTRAKQPVITLPPQDLLSSSSTKRTVSVMEQLQNLQISHDSQLSMSEKNEVYKVIKDLNSEKVFALLSTFISDSETESMANLLYSRLIELDPILSLNYLAENTQEKNITRKASEALMRLAKTDPEQALLWYRENIADSNLDPRNMGLARIFESFAENDLYGATDVILLMSQKQAQSGLYGVSKVFSDPQQYSAYLDYLEGFNKPFLVKPVMANWAHTQPEDMAAYLALKYPMGKTGPEHRLLLSRWSSTQPEKAANWYVNTVPASEKRKAINMIADRFQSRGSPNKTLNWLDQMEGVDTSTAIDNLIEGASSRNVDFAIANIDRISSDKARRNTARRIYKALKRDDPQRADEFKLNSEYGELLK
ncbi:MAG: hypothetical protein ACJAVV_002652 [Alphaproteobacteria bacterium]|jgi:hypothetical protein